MPLNNYIKAISTNLGLDENRVESVINLSESGCTIPFISRYRKEATGGLDEVQIKDVLDAHKYFVELDARKEYIISAIAQQDKLTDELQRKIEATLDKTALEDLYLPYKQNKRTKAERARLLGLEPLAKIIMAQTNPNIPVAASRFVKGDVKDVDSAIVGALDIIAEWVSVNESARNKVRRIYSRNALLECKVIKGKEQEGNKYENYFAFSKPLKYVSSHQILAILRAEKEGFLKSAIKIDNDLAVDALLQYFIRKDSQSKEYIISAVKDSFSRLIKPSVEAEFYSLHREEAEKEAIEVFKRNLRDLLMSPPVGKKRIMGIDPGFRTGCKIVCLDENGMLLYNDCIYPNAPHFKTVESKKKISRLVEMYRIEAISIGNGTASRETEDFIQSIYLPASVKVYVVNESGASVYSASPLARQEFPDKDVTVRGAVSIGRRLMDPLSELVKIPPQSIGVGQYQHDVNQSKLKDELDFVVDSCVNAVGVDVNTASRELLAHISGIGETLASNIINYRSENGSFITRKQILKVPRMGERIFEQCAGFLRIPDASNYLDRTAIHPERYDLVQRMASDLCVDVEDLVLNPEVRAKINLESYVDDTVGLPTLNDIMNELSKPGRDPRTQIKIVDFDKSIGSITDLRVGMVVNGIVTNITQFGAFVDLGIHDNGLLHVSQLAPGMQLSALRVNQVLQVEVIGVDVERHRISLSMKNI